MKKRVKIDKDGYHKIVIGTDLTKPTIVIWFEDEKSKIVESDIKSEMYAVGLGEHIAKELQKYVELHE